MVPLKPCLFSCQVWISSENFREGTENITNLGPFKSDVLNDSMAKGGDLGGLTWTAISYVVI